jgi:hypothetical protein
MTSAFVDFLFVRRWEFAHQVDQKQILCLVAPHLLLYEFLLFAQQPLAILSHLVERQPLGDRTGDVSR